MIFERVSNNPEQVIDERIAFLINDILKEAASRGTARKISQLDRNDFSGKTGNRQRVVLRSFLHQIASIP